MGRASDGVDIGLREGGVSEGIEGIRDGDTEGGGEGVLER